MTPILLTLPLRLVSELNSHTHWRSRQRRAKGQRSVTKAALWPRVVARASLPSRRLVWPVPPPWLVAITRIAPCALDTDNLAGSAKHVRDGVADALGVDDGDGRIEWRYEQRKSRTDEAKSLLAVAVRRRVAGKSLKVGRDWYGVEIRIESRQEAKSA